MNPYGIFILLAGISTAGSVMALATPEPERLYGIGLAVFCGLAAITVPIMKTLEEGRGPKRRFLRDED